MFKLVPNFSLKSNNSFGLDVRADYWLTLSSPEDYPLAMLRYPHLTGMKRLIIGSGTNLLFVSDFEGLIISPDFCGRTITYQDSQIIEIEVGAGEEWDEFVEYCVENGWYGVENLSLIPGRVGAVPVQNIGAYGAEAGDVIVRVDGINLETNAFESYTHDQCGFGYRSSIFKEQLSNLFMVTSVTFRLKKTGEISCAYGDLRKVMADFGEPNLKNLRKAVIQIRRSKLPDPGIHGNAGSFFKNPVVTEEVAVALSEVLPGLPVYPFSAGHVKVGAGFLIDQAGWKGYVFGRAAVHDKQALVLVNRGGATGREILELSQAIQQDVFIKFGVRLEPEVQVLD